MNANQSSQKDSELRCLTLILTACKQASRASNAYLTVSAGVSLDEHLRVEPVGAWHMALQLESVSWPCLPGQHLQTLLHAQGLLLSSPEA